MKTVLLTIAIIAVCVVLLGVKVLFVKGARFPSGYVHDNVALRRKGISCASGHGQRPTDRKITKNTIH
ncbi:hypothetical protein [uncultured Muribaculum sp.]|uniref:hypothetical protein n=1 Tax=uncultured Muribaculum sp. TaxID=1918613 RepID=UPI002633515B|nr:hypothetical protein [uncultured Muribaculum sp.]